MDHRGIAEARKHGGRGGTETRRPREGRARRALRAQKRPRNGSRGARRSAGGGPGAVRLRRSRPGMVWPQCRHPCPNTSASHELDRVPAPRTFVTPPVLRCKSGQSSVSSDQTHQSPRSVPGPTQPGPRSRSGLRVPRLRVSAASASSALPRPPRLISDLRAPICHSESTSVIWAGAGPLRAHETCRFKRRLNDRVSCTFQLPSSRRPNRMGPAAGVANPVESNVLAFGEPSVQLHRTLDPADTSGEVL